MKVETFVNKTIHYPNWDMSQSQIPFNFFRRNQSQTPKKKTHNVISFKKKAKKKKEKEKKKRTLQGVLVYLCERLNLPNL